MGSGVSSWRLLLLTSEFRVLQVNFNNWVKAQAEKGTFLFPYSLNSYLTLDPNLDPTQYIPTKTQ
jgi:hypothetical protein